MFEPTGSRRDAASTIFNLSDYRVIDALEVPGHARRVEVEATSPPGCPVCGVISTRVHSRRQQRIRDVPVAGAVDVIWCKRRWFCDEQLCGRGTFAESTIEVPARARSTLRLGVALVAAVVISGRAVSETARAHGVSWWMVQTAVTAACWRCPRSMRSSSSDLASMSTGTGRCGSFVTPTAGGGGSSLGAPPACGGGCPRSST